MPKGSMFCFFPLFIFSVGGSTMSLFEGCGETVGSADVVGESLVRNRSFRFATTGIWHWTISWAHQRIGGKRQRAVAINSVLSLFHFVFLSLFFSSSSSRVNLLEKRRKEREREDRGIGGSSITVVIVKIGPKMYSLSLLLYLLYSIPPWPENKMKIKPIESSESTSTKGQPNHTGKQKKNKRQKSLLPTGYYIKSVLAIIPFFSPPAILWCLRFLPVYLVLFFPPFFLKF